MALYWGAEASGWVLSGEACALIAAGGMALLALLGTWGGSEPPADGSYSGSGFYIAG